MRVTCCGVLACRVEDERERAAAAGGVVELQRGAGGLDEAAGDRQPQAGAGVVGAVAEALERLEHRWPAAARGMPGPRSTTRSSTCPPTVGGLDARRARRAATRRSRWTRRCRSPAPAAPRRCSTSGSVSDTSTTTLAAGGPRCPSAAATTSSSAVGRRTIWIAPACRRLMSSRLPMTRSSRSAAPSMLASNAARSVSENATDGSSSPETEALIDDSGVRRSCETARSSAVRSSLAWASTSTAGRLVAQPAGLQPEHELVGERVEHRVVVGGQLATDEHEEVVAVGVEGRDSAERRIRRGAGSPAELATDQSSVRARSPSPCARRTGRGAGRAVRAAGRPPRRSLRSCAPGRALRPERGRPRAPAARRGRRAR